MEKKLPKDWESLPQVKQDDIEAYREFRQRVINKETDILGNSFHEETTIRRSLRPRPIDNLPRQEQLLPSPSRSPSPSISSDYGADYAEAKRKRTRNGVSEDLTDEEDAYLDQVMADDVEEDTASRRQDSAASSKRRGKKNSKRARSLEEASNGNVSSVAKRGPISDEYKNLIKTARNELLDAAKEIAQGTGKSLDSILKEIADYSIPCVRETSFWNIFQRYFSSRDPGSPSGE